MNDRAMEKFLEKVGALLIIIIGFIFAGTYLVLAINFFICPDSDEVIAELTKVGYIKQEVIDNNIVNVITNDKLVPLVTLWRGKGLILQGNVIK